MRRKLASIAIAGLGATLFGGTTAQAQNAVDIIISEGIGEVCEAADLRSPGIAGKNEKSLYGQYKPDDFVSNGSGGWNLKAGATKDAWCNYPGTEGYDAPVNPGQTTHPQWWTPATGSQLARNKWFPTQGLTAPGIGPGAIGPYSLEIKPNISDTPANNCVSSIGGQGCGTRLVGILTPAPTNGFGAHAGSSQGNGIFDFTSADGSIKNSGVLGWENSAATVLPLQGEITAGVGDGRLLVGFSSSRGVSGQNSYGNAGVTLPTNGFQVEGVLVIYDAV